MFTTISKAPARFKSTKNFKSRLSVGSFDGVKSTFRRLEKYNFALRFHKKRVYKYSKKVYHYYRSLQKNHSGRAVRKFLDVIYIKGG